jgi:23S rRNA (adenine-N6)-dimethyltransferase
MCPDRSAPVSSRNRKRISLSQNLIRKPSVARRLVQAASISRYDTVLEIGSGTGILTSELARHAGKVIAVEADPKMVLATRERTSSFRNVEIHEKDFFGFCLPGDRFRVFANIPYNATAAIIDRLTNCDPLPFDTHLVVQKQAAERFTGDPTTTMKSALLYPWFEFDVVEQLRRSDFVPRPRVDSVLMRIESRQKPLIIADLIDLYRDFVSFGFSAWKPDLRTAYAHVITGGVRLAIEEMGIDLDRRPSELAPGDWVKMFDVFCRAAPATRQSRVSGTFRELKEREQRLKKSHRTRSNRKRW